jgi:hypothetical protein
MLINYKNRIILHEFILFNKFVFYYVKKKKAYLWYPNKIPFFRIGFIILYK